MYAIKSRRPPGFRRSGVFFEHTQWRLLENPTESQLSEPALEAIEVSGADDEKLGGLSAEAIEDPEDDDTPSDLNGDGVVDDIEKNSMKDLRELAKSLNIDVPKGVSKTELASLVRDAQNTYVPTKPEDELHPGAGQSDPLGSKDVIAAAGEATG